MRSKKIFISYRRADERGYAQSLRAHLLQDFDANDIFMDVADGIPAGADFRQIIEQAVVACDTFLTVIGPKWADLLQERAGQDTDWIELETRLALQLNKRVIPVLVNNATLPGRDALPETLHPLLARQAVALRPDSFEHDAARLTRELKPSRRLPLVALGATALAVIIGGITAYYWQPAPTDRASCLAALSPETAKMTEVAACYQNDPPSS